MQLNSRILSVARLLTLVRSASGGDRAAFGEMYSPYSRMVHGILLARVRPADAEDLTHGAFLAAMDRLPALRGQRAFGGWLASIARSEAIDPVLSRRPLKAIALCWIALGLESADWWRGWRRNW